MSRLPASSAKKARELITKFRMAPTSAGLNYERIQAAKDKCIHSLRVDQDYRAIVWASPQGNNFVLLWLDKHDDAYAWAKVRRVEVNPELGALQVYTLADSVSDAPAPSSQDSASTPMLFAALRDRELLRLGVPEELVGLVRGIRSEADLDAAEPQLPGLAYQGLFMVAAGYGFEDAIRELDRTSAVQPNIESEELLQSAESRSQFFLLEDDQALEEMLNAPLEKWRVFLHPSQRRIVDKDWNGPAKVLGGPGTGKTVVALHRARRLAQLIPHGDSRKILFTTFTKNLAADIEDLLARLCEPEELCKIEVENIDAVARSILKKCHFEQTVMFESSQEVQELWQEALNEIILDDFPESFYREEWEEVIQPQHIQDLEAYKLANRSGRGVRVSRQQLIKIWPVFETYFKLLREKKWIESQDAFYAAAQLIQGASPYAAIIVDESQDMGIPALAMLRKLVPAQMNDLFLVGDAHQAIYKRKTVLSRAGIDVRGRSRRLLLNYRTTKQIGAWAARYIEGMETSDLDGGVEGLKGYHSIVSGIEPLDLRDRVPEEKLAQVRRYLESLSPEECESCCITSSTHETAQEWKQNLDSWGISASMLGWQKNMDSQKAGVRVATIHRIKGLEFDRVIVSLPRDSFPQAKFLGFVAATRAKKELVVL